MSEQSSSRAASGSAEMIEEHASDTAGTGKTSISESVPAESLSTLSQPLPIPPYQFDPTLTEDENMLVWVSILARHSYSKRGHMGTIFVQPPTLGDPASSPSDQCLPQINDRIKAYANNTPLLFSTNMRSVPEIHAEALAISRSARRGISLEGCTVYISFPPCNECFKMLMGAGIARCVYKKSISPGYQGEAVLVAAEAEGLAMKGTLDNLIRAKVTDKGKEEEGKQRALERKEDDARDARVRAFWASQGEDGPKTRARVARWWGEWSKRYKAAERRVGGRWGILKGDNEADSQQSNGTQHGEAARSNGDEVDLDELANNVPYHVPTKRLSEDTSATLAEKLAKRENS